jgi:hypothetical protein
MLLLWYLGGQQTGGEINFDQHGESDDDAGVGVRLL